MQILEPVDETIMFSARAQQVTKQDTLSTHSYAQLQTQRKHLVITFHEIPPLCQLLCGVSGYSMHVPLRQSALAETHMQKARMSMHSPFMTYP